MLYKTGEDRCIAKGCSEYMLPNDRRCKYCGKLYDYVDGVRFIACYSCHHALGAAGCMNVMCTANAFKLLEPQTQKAKGIMVLHEKSARVERDLQVGILNTVAYKAATIIKQADELRLYATSGTKIFARPCPVLPRPGFVDSRIVGTMAELVMVAEETYEEDKEGEVMLCDFIKASFNVTLVPNVMTTGPGHDGATSGGDVVVVPVVGVGQILGDEIMRLAGVIEAPHFEAVFLDCELPVITQLRDGPCIPTTVDFIPRDTVVKHVIRLGQYTPLLAWQKIIEVADSGTVVYNALGVGLSSHYGVHCIMKGVPFIGSHTPYIGEALVKIVDTLEIDRREFMNGLKLGFSIELMRDIHIMYKYGLFSLAVLHNMIGFTTKESRLVGVAVSLTIRLGMAALYGEARHARVDEVVVGGSVARHSVYDAVFHNLAAAFAGLPELKERWRGQWGSNYGGYKWLECHESLEGLITATTHLIKSRGRAGFKKNLAQVICAFNVVVNTAHNGGKWFDKFYASKWFDIATKHPAVVALQVAPTFYSISTMENTKRALSKIVATNVGGVEGSLKPWESFKKKEPSDCDGDERRTKDELCDDHSCSTCYP